MINAFNCRIAGLSALVPFDEAPAAAAPEWAPPCAVEELAWASAVVMEGESASVEPAEVPA
ncbi:hypothetical protein, partial [Paraburkholderia sp.]|uniref:hypothetical protein n=1 Tax=Paraburkholderia sp. TaxID=1926495 RepID=UPI0025EABF1F